MKTCLRIKPYFHLLQRNTVVDFIKTLDETVKVPAGHLFDNFLETLQNLTDESEIIAQMSAKLAIPAPLAQQFLDKLLELGILEYYHEPFPADLNRYHRQLLFFDSLSPQPQFDDNFARQQKIADTHVLVLGIGGIGNYLAMALAAAGVGRLTLVDNDVVEESNLHRQVLFDERHLGQPKAQVAAQRLKTLHPKGGITAVQQRVTRQEDLAALLEQAGAVDYLVLSADYPPRLVLWASALCPEFGFKYLKCGYMAHQGLIGPLLGPKTRRYEALFEPWADEIAEQTEGIAHQNDQYIAPSMAASNGILANIAALELIKDMTGVIPSNLLERRLLFNLKTMQLYEG